MKGVAELAAMLRYGTRCKVVRYGMHAMLAAALACLAVALAWWGPTKHGHTQLLRSIDEKRLAMVEDLRSDQVVRAHREALTALALLEKKFHVRTGQAELIQGIARLASRRNVRVISQSFEEGKTEGGDAPLYLEIGLHGSYALLRQLMGDLATLPMWIEIVETRFEREGETGAEVRAQLRLLTYREIKGQQ